MELKNKHIPCEEKEQDYLYKIGMFAAMNHVTVKALRFYETQGLLYPAYVDEESGYRYYTMSQMATVHQISALKSAGFTLDDIMRINSGADGAAFLQQKKADLLQKIAELTRQLATIDGFLANQSIHLDTPVLVRTIPAVLVAYTQERIDSYDCLFDLMPKLGEQMEAAGCECAVPEYCFTSYPEPGYKEEDILVEVCEAVTMLKDDMGPLRFKELPETTAACIFHKGSYASFPESYAVALKFVEENGYRISGDIREKYIDGVWNKDDESQWLTEIQIPIEKIR